MSVTEQVGGDHYKAEIQHWDLMEEHDISYLEATASKYPTRWRKKGGTQDLRKAATYLERALEEERGARRLVPEERLEAFFEANNLGEWERSILRLIHLDGSQIALICAAQLLRDKAEDVDRLDRLDVELQEERGAARVMPEGARP